MNESTPQRPEYAGISREALHSALFAQMILQWSNMAMLMLGKVPDPHSGKTMRDLEAAQLFIDQLEALEAKTKGNLSKEEEALLKQTLMALRLAFVEAVESPAPAEPTANTSQPPEPRETAAAAEEKKPEPATGAEAASEEASGKRFSKKYSA